ncbi:MAG: hypothetical protein HKN19_19310 [Halioglobus sp.]|nr:hypothetical protein [Halioglobus sp.]
MAKEDCATPSGHDFALANCGRRATRRAILKQSLAFTFVVALGGALDPAPALAAPGDGARESGSASSHIRLVIPPALQATGVDDISLYQLDKNATAYSDEFCLQGTAALGYRIIAQPGNAPYQLRNAQNRELPYQVRYRSDLRQEGGELLEPGTYSGPFRSDPRADACRHGRAVAFDLELSPEDAASAGPSAYSGSLTLTLVVE